MSEAITLKPIKDKIFVELITDQEVSGKFMLMENSQDVPNKGVALAVGPGLKDNPMDVQVGDTVLFTKGIGEKLVWEDREMLVIHETDVLAIK